MSINLALYFSRTESLHSLSFSLKDIFAPNLNIVFLRASIICLRLIWQKSMIFPPALLTFGDLCRSLALSPQPVIIINRLFFFLSMSSFDSRSLSPVLAFDLVIMPTDRDDAFFFSFSSCYHLAAIFAPRWLQLERGTISEEGIVCGALTGSSNWSVCVCVMHYHTHICPLLLDPIIISCSIKFALVPSVSRCLCSY